MFFVPSGVLLINETLNSSTKPSLPYSSKDTTSGIGGMITWPRRSCREAVLAVLLSLILSVKSVASQAGIKSLEVLLLDSPPFTCNDQVS